MIEAVTAKNGCTVFRWGGRLLASQVDPVDEAREWVRRRMNLVDQVKSIVVLGVGAGYHIQELRNQTEATLLIVEHNSELLEKVCETHAFDSDRVRLVTLNSARSLRTDDEIRRALMHSFVILKHAPSVACAPEFYRDCETQLLGRDWGTLNWQWQMKGFASLESTPKIHSSAEPLSILDLEQTELVQNSQERERMLIKALRELVK